MKQNQILLFSEDERHVHFFSDVSDSPVIEEQSGWMLRNVEIFKTGTYRGQTFTEEDLDQMVDNFTQLKSTFEPVFKKNHSEDVGDQIGWIQGVRREGELLIADLHLTDWQAYEKFREKTWKYLSSEIYPPALALEEFGINGYVLRGVAVVSVPKVKGLKGIILNSEVLENEEANILDKKQIIAMLKKLGMTFSEQEEKDLTVEQLEEKLTHKFSELSDEKKKDGQQGQQGGEGKEKKQTSVEQFGEKDGKGMVMMSHDDVIALSERISAADKKSLDLFTEVEKLKNESKESKIRNKVDAFKQAGKVTPAEEEKVIAFAENLDDKQLQTYFESIDSRTPVVSFGETGGQQQQEEEDDTDKAWQEYQELRKPKTYE